MRRKAVVGLLAEFEVWTRLYLQIVALEKGHPAVAGRKKREDS